MTDTLREQLERAAAPPETRTVLDLIDGMSAELAKSLQSEAAAATLARHYYTAVRFNPLLLQCTAESLVAALLLSAQVRLEPGPLGHVYLVPFQRRGVHEVVWIVGYTGIIELARRGGAVGLSSTLVREGDEYERPWQDEKGVHYRHRPAPEDERGDRLCLLVTWQEASAGRLVRQAQEVPR